MNRMRPSVEEILERSHVVALPMRVKFRGITTREALLIDGPAGWGEFSPFVEYDAVEASSWLASGIEAAWEGFPSPVRQHVEVNATIPAVTDIEEVVARYPGCRVFKVKVAEPGQTLADDIARVDKLRQLVPNAVVRVDANQGWSVAEAIEAAKSLGPLDYMEQPVATVDELREVRMTLQRSGIFCRIAADESIRKADDPYLVAEKQAADLAVVKVAPLGGVRRTVELARNLHVNHHMDITVASALDTAVGINAGLAAVAAFDAHIDDDGIHVRPNAAGLATGQLFVEDVAEPLELVDGHLPVAPRTPSTDRLSELAASGERRDWWFHRVREAYAAM